MCSRFEQSAGPELVRRFRTGKLPEGVVKGEIRPTDQALVIRDGGNASLLGWGLSVSWDTKPLINARAETLGQKITFRPLLDNRCLVPADAYFEWRRDAGQRVKTRIAAADGPMAFAGLTDGDRFTIVTCAPSPEIAFIHNRMPVILTEEGTRLWLDSRRPFEEAAKTLVPFKGTLSWQEDTPDVQADLFS